MTRSYTLSEQARARRDAQRQSTRQALLAAARSIAASRGLEAISVVEVARRAGVSHSLINAYFDGKAGLIAALVKEGYSVLLDRTEEVAAGPGDAVERLRRVLENWARFDLADPRLLKVLQAHGWTWSSAAEAENRADRGAFLAPVARLIEEGQAAGIIRSQLTQSDALAGLWAIYTVGMREAVFADPIPTPEAAVDMLWGPLAALLLPV